MYYSDYPKEKIKDKINHIIVVLMEKPNVLDIIVHYDLIGKKLRII